jgi:hypothetical protein
MAAIAVLAFGYTCPDCETVILLADPLEFEGMPPS